MKVLLLALFVALASAMPIPDDDGGPVEVIVNGVPEGMALELGGILDVKVQEKVEGEVVSATNVLHPFTAVGIAEAAAAAIVDRPVPVPNEINPDPVLLPEPDLPEIILPGPVVLPTPELPHYVPDPIILPSPALPQIIPDPVVLPSPALPQIIPDPVVLPDPALPEILPQPVELPNPNEPDVYEPMPVPAPQVPNGEIFNDGVVQVNVNGPEDSTIMSTLTSWFNIALNYINGGEVQSTQQIIG